MTLTSVAVIPARYASTRFPGKPLAKLHGRSLIEHVWLRTSRSSLVHKVLVATDDERIRDEVLRFGGECIMTSKDHLSGSDRLGEVASFIDADVIVNVQGDEPMIDPMVIDSVIKPFLTDDPPDIATAAVPITDPGDYENPDVVKVVVDSRGCALYFSRSSIPHGWSTGTGKALRHLGIYAYNRDSLILFVSLPEGSLEKSEKLEQLRALENGMRIAVVPFEGFCGIGVDRPEDLEKAEKMMRDLELQEGQGLSREEKEG